VISELPQDHAGRALAAWQNARPDLDLSPAHVLARMRRLSSLVEPQLEVLLGRYGLNHAAFDTLSTLRRGGPPYTMSARELAAQCLRTPATLTARIARLVHDGLVDRSNHPNDGRGVLITLTDRGRQLIDEVAPTYLEAEKQLLSGLEDTERDALAQILHQLLLSFEGFDTTSRSGRFTGALPRLGLWLESLHTSAELRRSVGLPYRRGMVVASVDPRGPGARAGLAPGDLIVEVDDTPLRALPVINERLSLTEKGRVVVRLIRRGDEEHRVEVIIPTTNL
jgi:DNA-binding MarR family transcriptional regulator